MGSANRVQIAAVRETTAGTTPTTPRMRLVRATGESLDFSPEYVDSDELRSDRMLGAPILVMQGAKGGLNTELSFPDDNSPLSDLLRSTFFSTWVNTPNADNDGTADSNITDVANTNGILTGAFSGTVAVGHLVRTTGFTNSANNAVNRCTTASATVPRFSAANFTNETAPPAAARAKVVGFAGVSGDITATGTGLGSTTLDFTTLGIVAGQWIKVGGTAAGDKFATSALNTWIRVTGIAATALTCDNLPAAWTTDAGTSKTIKVWFGDYIRNGTTATSLSFEKGFLDQGTPTYIIETGMQVNSLSLDIKSKSKITGAFDFLGTGGSQSTSALDASPDAVTTGLVMAANANVGRIAENNSALTDPNWAESLSLKINNNLRTMESIDSTSPVGVVPGQFDVTLDINTYFGSNALLTKCYNGTATSVNTRISKNSQAMIFTVPTVYLRGGGNPTASGKNTDVMAQFTGSAAYNSTYGCSLQLDRFEYFEA